MVCLTVRRDNPPVGYLSIQADKCSISHVRIPILVTTFPEWLSDTEPLPHTSCVRLRCVCSVLRAHAQYCRFDKADATADVN